MNSNFISKASKYNPFNTSDVTRHYRTMLPYHKLIDSAVLSDSQLFFGDSLTQALAVSVLDGRNVNFGIGQDTTAGLLKRLPSYSSLQHASMVVLAIGVNDLWKRNVDETLKNYSLILQEIPDSTSVIVNSVFPVDPSTLKTPLDHRLVDELNTGLKKLTLSRENTVFLDMTPEFADETGALLSSLHVGDGLHINAKGYRIWIEKLNNALMNFTVAASTH